MQKLSAPLCVKPTSGADFSDTDFSDAEEQQEREMH